MKFCPYCMGAHNRRGARYCCAKHARSAGAQRAAETGRRRRAWAKVMARIHERVRFNPEWRQIAMGIDVEGNLGKVFGPGAERGVDGGVPAVLRSPPSGLTAPRTRSHGQA